MSCQKWLALTWCNVIRWVLQEKISDSVAVGSVALTFPRIMGQFKLRLAYITQSDRRIASERESPRYVPGRPSMYPPGVTIYDNSVPKMMYKLIVQFQGFQFDQMTKSGLNVQSTLPIPTLCRWVFEIIKLGLVREVLLFSGRQGPHCPLSGAGWYIK